MNQEESKKAASNSSEDLPILTTRNGHPIVDNQNLRTVGNRGPATLENYQFLEKISHFDRERVPERVVHVLRKFLVDSLVRFPFSSNSAAVYSKETQLLY